MGHVVIVVGLEFLGLILLCGAALAGDTWWALLKARRDEDGTRG